MSTLGTLGVQGRLWNDCGSLALMCVIPPEVCSGSQGWPRLLLLGWVRLRRLDPQGETSILGAGMSREWHLLEQGFEPVAAQNSCPG